MKEQYLLWMHLNVNLLIIVVEVIPYVHFTNLPVSECWAVTEALTSSSTIQSRRVPFRAYNTNG